ncbi:MAG: S-layer family protein, partial [Merismopedia sp. SIO2A8]|nr:S-layer family protein [Merismopedia sp. SIO2A8]
FRLFNGSQLSTSTFGPGQAGDIHLNASEIEIHGQFNPDNFLQNNGLNITFPSDLLFSSVNGLSTTTPESFVIPTLADFIPIDSLTRNGTVVVAQLPQNLQFPSGIFTQSSPIATGDAGNVVINANQFLIHGGGAIAATTFGAGNGGNIRIQADSNRIGNGTGGSILSGAANGATGESGSLALLGDTVTLNNGRLLTETSSGRGGDITIAVTDRVLLQEGSIISATAGTEQNGGNGGDISITASVVFAADNQDNDITANAFSGNGGTIEIVADSILGLTPRAAVPGNGTNDIDASSQLSEPGQVILTSPTDTDPTAGLSEFPSEVTDTTQQVAATCPTSGNIAAELGEFVITGRGGIPANPADIISGHHLTTHLAILGENSDRPTLPPKDSLIATTSVDASSSQSFLSNQSLLNNQSFLNGPLPVPQLQPSPHHSPQVSSPSPSLVEAQGWIRHEDGTIILTSRPDQPESASFQSPHCSSMTTR